ncbi:MAG: F0F1 ATP synthase subunit epsilon [Candidatus Carbobacillus altaicus]|uniref:ATP synthase epsilon chain n=1 Tax=Candidatus Carbonibacillus altaicus TaxID=2163959 RepID=A0A2R6Y3Y8_9BACL|nr:F0F1 ATP synthase subunit epsilon [Candidatus Carbobacillus altaicus]PTQ57399.1 MAG: ATP synthase epsilon chain [Candidatus Carbobacillus altaicus]
MHTYRLEIVTPERKVFDGEIRFLSVRGIEGDLGIAKDHLPLVTPLDIHPAKLVFPDGSVKRVAVSGGFLEVRKNEVTILAEAAELPEEIDVDRALRAKERAEEALKKAREREFLMAQYALRRALVRLDVAEDSKTKV